MTVSPQEMSAFKAALQKSSTEAIQKNLDNNVIARDWKREIAEAEIERRTGMSGNASATTKSAPTNKLHKSAVLKGWGVTILLIIAAMAGSLMFLLNRTSQ
jgi:hypothetical protein